MLITVEYNKRAQHEPVSKVDKTITSKGIILGAFLAHRASKLKLKPHSNVHMRI